MVSGWTSVCLFVHLSVICLSVCILFLEDDLSKPQWIFTKLGMCIDIVELWFWIASGQISSNSDSYLHETHPYFRFQMITCVNVKGF